MRIAGNKLKHISDFFHSELREVYPASEIDAMLAVAVETVLGFSRTDQLIKQDENINQSDLLKLYDCAKDLKKNIPLQHSLGETWFYNLRFKVSPSVLIPRPETEELVELILKENPGLLSVLDIGTGSGCIPVSIKSNSLKTEVFACDISTDALLIAKKNATLNKVEINFFEANALDEKDIPLKTKNSFEIIVSNPPYIKADEKKAMEKNVLEHEPHLALFVEGADSIIFYKKIIDLCSKSLAHKGRLYFELNPLTAEEVQSYAEESHLFEKTFLIIDMSGVLRFFKGIKN